MVSILTKTINSGNIDNLRKMLFTPNKFTNADIDNSIMELKRKKNSAILDINNTISDKTFNKMIEMLTDYKNSKLVDNKMQLDTHRYMQSYLVGGKKKSRKLRSNKRRTKKRKHKKKNTKKRRK
mgnify:CR=1 FL=1|uniref:Uncharacterized protein n=1 Tax=viral metagenome TaxID=1070528 RepID=A0A6C0EIK4_9ZZZZ